MVLRVTPALRLVNINIRPRTICKEVRIGTVSLGHLRCRSLVLLALLEQADSLLFHFFFFPHDESCFRSTRSKRQRPVSFGSYFRIISIHVWFNTIILTLTVAACRG